VRRAGYTPAPRAMDGRAVGYVCAWDEVFISVFLRLASHCLH
jgi:hypothetical protein